MLTGRKGRKALRRRAGEEIRPAAIKRIAVGSRAKAGGIRITPIVHGVKNGSNGIARLSKVHLNEGGS